MHFDVEIIVTMPIITHTALLNARNKNRKYLRLSGGKTIHAWGVLH